MRFAIRWALKLACIYLMAVLGVMTTEETILFGAGGETNCPLPDVPIEEVWLQTEDGVKLHSLFFPYPGNRDLPNAERRAVLFFHGNGGDTALWAWCGPQWHAILNADVLIMDYRGFGKSGGAPSESGCYRDARAAYQWITHERGYNPQNVILVGRSLGSGVAIELATRVPHGGVIVGDAYTSTVDVAQRLYPWLPVRWMIRNRFDSLSRIDKINGPFFAFHGAQDALMPLDQPQLLLSRAANPKQLFVVEDGAHGTKINEGFAPAVQAFFGGVSNAKSTLAEQ